MVFINCMLLVTYKQRSVNSDSISRLYPFYHLINRLDYDVSGILIYIYKYIHTVFHFHKVYYALVYGLFPLFYNITSICNYRYSLSRLYLITYLHTLNISFIKIEIITGRKNQIRKQLSFIGYPILLDKRFGNYLLDRFIKNIIDIQGIQLLSYRLSILYESNCIPYISLRKWLSLKRGKQYLRKIKH
ncbi:pseudouridine synthase [Candidatus Vidania fulgoroideorum]